MHFQQRRELAKTLAIRRVGDKHTDLASLPLTFFPFNRGRHRQRVFQLADIGLFEGDEVCDTGRFGVVASFEQHALVGITAKQLHFATLHAAFGAHLRFHHQALPQFAIMLQPAIRNRSARGAAPAPCRRR